MVSVAMVMSTDPASILRGVQMSAATEKPQLKHTGTVSGCIRVGGQIKLCTGNECDYVQMEQWYVQSRGNECHMAPEIKS